MEEEELFQGSRFDDLVEFSCSMQVVSFMVVDEITFSQTSMSSAKAKRPLTIPTNIEVDENGVEW
jgi:hypothetical protein